MDLNTFYALFSATCFTLVGLWWNVVQSRPWWVADKHARRAVGGVYLTFSAAWLIGLFAQVGGTGNPTIWRVGFVASALVGAVTTTRTLILLRGTTGPRAKHLAVGLLYTLVVTAGVADAGTIAGLRPIQVEALLLIGLVLIGHGLVWDFFITSANRTHPRSPDNRPG